jgi:hypothetical protein
MYASRFLAHKQRFLHLIGKVPQLLAANCRKAPADECNSGSRSRGPRRRPSGKDRVRGGRPSGGRGPRRQWSAARPSELATRIAFGSDLERNVPHRKSRLRLPSRGLGRPSARSRPSCLGRSRGRADLRRGTQCLLSSSQGHIFLTNPNFRLFPFFSFFFKKYRIRFPYKRQYRTKPNRRRVCKRPCQPGFPPGPSPKRAKGGAGRRGND